MGSLYERQQWGQGGMACGYVHGLEGGGPLGLILLISEFGAYMKARWPKCGCTDMTAGSAASYETFGGTRLTLAHPKLGGL